MYICIYIPVNTYENCYNNVEVEKGFSDTFYGHFERKTNKQIMK